MFIAAELNETSRTFLGETYGAWTIGLITGVASLAVAIAAWRSSLRANKIAAQANELAAEARSDAQALVEAQWVEAQRQELDHVLAEMARLAASHPLPSQVSADGKTPIALPEGILGAFQAYGAGMGRAREIERRIKDRGYIVQLRGGHKRLFPDFEFQEYDRLRELLYAMSQPNPDVNAQQMRDLHDYWSRRWFNLPRVAGVEREKTL